MKSSTPILPHIDHAARDEPFAERADAAVVEREPAPERIGFLEDCQLLIKTDPAIRGASHGATRRMFFRVWRNRIAVRCLTNAFP